MIVNDVKNRVITFKAPKIYSCDGDEMHLQVTRSRTSTGFAGISIRWGGNLIEINNDFSMENGGGYEQIVRELIDLLDNAVGNPCTVDAAMEGKS